MVGDVTGSHGVASPMGRRYGDLVAFIGEQCPARVELSDAQVQWFESRPYRAHQVERHYDCALEFGHAGPHGAMGQLEWWIRWTLSSSEIQQTKYCPAIDDERDEYDEEVVCLLFEDHPGGHSFELGRRQATPR
jgi:hypothetical protein